MHAILLLITYTIVFGTGKCSPFTSYVNVEKLYTLEDELISIADAVITQENAMHDREDVHDLEKIRSVMEPSQEIHTHVEASNDSLSTYIIHPINIFHLTKRLVRDWTDVVTALGESKTCMLTMSSKIKNIDDNMPGEDKLTQVCRDIMVFQTIHNITVADVIAGKIADKDAIKPLSLNDAFLFARVAYDTRDFIGAADWLAVVIAKYSNDCAEFELTAAYNLLSSTYFMLERPKDALAMLDKILELDPENVSAKRNRKFMLTKVQDGPNMKGLTRKSKKRIFDACPGQKQMAAKQESHHVCAYYKQREDGILHRPSVKAEIFNLKPLVVMFHDVINRTEAKAMYYLAYEQMRDLLYKDVYQYPDGIDSIYVRDDTKWQWYPALNRKLHNIEISSHQPATSHFIVTTTGMSGYPMQTTADDHRIGTFLVFLSDAGQGGEVVFPSSNTVVTPVKGSVLFYEKKLNHEASICPVLVDTMWVGVYPLYGVDTHQVCPKQPVIKPRIR